jgi:hypothetical protein
MFRQSSLVLAIAATALIAGCAGPQHTWRKEGASADSAHTALSECKYQIGLNKVSEEKQKELLSQCMEGKGFRWR